MGRPSLNVKRISAYLPGEMLDRIDALVGEQKRSEFIREAVRGALMAAEMAARAADRRK